MNSSNGEIDGKVKFIFSQYLKLSQKKNFEEMNKLIKDFDCSERDRHEMLAVLAITVNLKNLLSNRASLVHRVKKQLSLTLSPELVKQHMKGLE